MFPVGNAAASWECGLDTAATSTPPHVPLAPGNDSLQWAELRFLLPSFFLPGILWPRASSAMSRSADPCGGLGSDSTKGPSAGVRQGCDALATAL